MHTLKLVDIPQRNSETLKFLNNLATIRLEFGVKKNIHWRAKPRVAVEIKPQETQFIYSCFACYMLYEIIYMQQKVKVAYVQWKFKGIFFIS